MSSPHLVAMLAYMKQNVMFTGSDWPNVVKIHGVF